MYEGLSPTKSVDAMFNKKFCIRTVDVAAFYNVMIEIKGAKEYALTKKGANCVAYCLLELAYIMTFLNFLELKNTVVKDSRGTVVEAIRDNGYGDKYFIQTPITFNLIIKGRVAWFHNYESPCQFVLHTIMQLG